MTRKIMRRVSWPIVFAGLAAPFMTNCGGLPKMPGVPGLPGGNCPDMNIEAIDKFDFASNFKLNAQVGAKLKAGVGAAVELKALADKLDADLLTACGGLAKDLGDTGTYTNGQDACKAAMNVMGTVKAKMGANVSFKLDIDPPKCGASVDAMADCAAHCDASVSGPSAEVKCDGGDLQGGCSGQCTGSCSATAAAACTGECSGTCDANISGSCDGNCSGKCDGKATTGGASGAQCAGKCEGKCSGNVKGTCSGKCGGDCKLSGSASCSGTCTGQCSVKFTAPKCTGTLVPPKMSADCSAKCNAKVQAKVECVPPQISLRITGSADAQAAATYQAAIEKNLPVVLNVAIGMGKQIIAVGGSVKAVIEGAQATIQTATSDKLAGAALIACVASPFKGAIDAAAGLQASVNVSVNVQASASASGSAKAGG